MLDRFLTHKRLALFAILLSSSLAIHAKSAEEVYGLASRSVVSVIGLDTDNKQVTIGSGVAFAKGKIATVCHVISKSSRIIVHHESRELSAKVLNADNDHDICVLEVQAPIAVRKTPVSDC